MAETETPRDLVRLADVLDEFKPSRSWWDRKMSAGDIQAYTVPGERGLWLSRTDVERLLQPRPHERSAANDA